MHIIIIIKYYLMLPLYVLVICFAIVSPSTISKRWATPSECKKAFMGTSKASMKEDLDYLVCNCDTTVNTNTNPLHFISSPSLVTALMNNSNRKTMINQQSPQLGSPLYCAISNKNWPLALEIARHPETDLLVGKGREVPYSILPKKNDSEDKVLTELRAMFKCNIDDTNSLNYYRGLAASIAYFGMNQYNTPDVNYLKTPTSFELYDLITQKNVGDFEFIPFRDYLSYALSDEAMEEWGEPADFNLLFKATKAWEVEYLLKYTKASKADLLSQRLKGKHTPFTHHLSIADWEAALALIEFSEYPVVDDCVDGEKAFEIMEKGHNSETGKNKDEHERRCYQKLLRILTPRIEDLPPTTMVVRDELTAFGRIPKRPATQDECHRSEAADSFLFDPTIVEDYKDIDFTVCPGFTFKKLWKSDSVHQILGEDIERISPAMIEPLNREENSELLFLIRNQRWDVVLEILKYSIIKRRPFLLSTMKKILAEEDSKTSVNDMKIMQEIERFLAIPDESSAKKAEIYTSIENNGTISPKSLIRAGDIDLFLFWMDRNPGLIEYIDHNGNSFLYHAIMNKKENFINFLMAEGSLIDIVNDEGYCCLHLLSLHGFDSIIRSSRNAFMSFVNRQYHPNFLTPLHLAILAGHVDVVSTLIAMGADVHSKAADGRGALELSKENETINEIIQNILESHNQRRKDALRQLKDEECKIKELKEEKDERDQKFIEEQREEIKSILKDALEKKEPLIIDEREMQRKIRAQDLANFLSKQVGDDESVIII